VFGNEKNVCFNSGEIETGSETMTFWLEGRILPVAVGRLLASSVDFERNIEEMFFNGAKGQMLAKAGEF